MKEISYKIYWEFVIFIKDSWFKNKLTLRIGIEILLFILDIGI